MRFYLLPLTVAGAFSFRVWVGLDHFHKADAIFIAKMANDIASGIAYPLVYYGQNYMGTIESWITAPLFLITGPTWWGVGFAPVMVSSFGVIAFYLLGRSLADERAGIFAAILWAVTPFSMMFYNVTPRGPYPVIVCGSALALFWAVERFKGKRFKPGYGFLMGLTLGLMLWTSVLAAPAIGVVLFFTLAADGRKVINRTNIAGVSGFIAGGLLYLPQAFTAKGEKTLVIELARIGDGVTALAKTVYESFLPYLAMSPPPLLFWSQKTVFTIMTLSLAIMTALVVYRWFKKEKNEPRGGRFTPVLVFTLLFSAAFIVSPTGLDAQPRHILPLYAPMIVATAVGFSRLSIFRGAIPIVVIFAMTLSNGYLNVFTFSVLAKNTSAQEKIVKEAADILINRNVHSLTHNDYELRNRLMWEAATRGYLLDTMGYSGSRDPKMTLAVERDKKAAFGFPLAWIKNFAANYRSCCGDDFKVETIPGMAIILPGKPVWRATESIPPAKWRLAGQYKALGDRKFTTTLATENSFIIELDRPAPVSKVRIVYGGRRPVRMAISLSNDRTDWLTVKPASGPSPFVPADSKSFFRTGFRPEREFEEINFPPAGARYIRFEVKQPPGQVFDIHELFIYRAAFGANAKAGKTASPDDIAKAARQSGVKLLASDRWLAATLFDMKKDFKSVTPPFRSFDKRLQTSRLKPEGLGALVEKADKAELSALLEKKKIKYQKTDLGDKTLYSIKSGDGTLWWTGFTLIDW